MQGVSQVFVKKGGDRTTLVVAEVIEEFLIAGRTESIRKFIRHLAAEFEVGNSCVGGAFRFNGCEIDVGSRAIELSMWNYLERLKSVPMSRSRSKERDDKATAAEEKAYRALAGTLMYFGNAVIPQGAMVTSRMQHQLKYLRVRHIIDGNLALK